MKIGVVFPQGWRDFGATHLDVITKGAGTPQAHIDLLKRFKTEVGLSA